MQGQIGGDESQRAGAFTRQLLCPQVRHVVQLRHRLLNLFPGTDRDMLRVVNDARDGLIRNPRKEGDIIESDSFHALWHRVSRGPLLWHSDAVKTCERFAKLNNPLRLRDFSNARLLAEPGQTELDKWANGQGVHYRSHPKRAAKHAPNQQDGHLNGGTHAANGPSQPGMNAGHQAVARAWPKTGADVHAGRNCVHHDTRHQESDAHR